MQDGRSMVSEIEMVFFAPFADARRDRDGEAVNGQVGLTRA